MTIITLAPDRALWDRQINAVCDRFERRVRGGIQNRVHRVQNEVVPVVERRRRRPADRSQPRTPLATAIQQSIRPDTTGWGIVVGDRNILNALAPHWHAIEVGSTHIVGMQFWGYIGPEGAHLPSRGRFGRESRRATYRELVGSGRTPISKAVVKRPIMAHGYLKSMGEVAVEAVTTEIDQRVKEVFGGIPVKKQGA
jgi:hypothetical protein